MFTPAQSEPAPPPNEADAQFLARLNHEVRSPLNAIVGFAELLGDGTYGTLTEAQQEVVGDILCAVHHLRQLLTDSLDVSRIRAGRAELSLEVLSVASLVDQAACLCRNDAAGRTVTLLEQEDNATSGPGR